MSLDYESQYADVTDVNVLKQKRRARRGMITHQEQYINRHSKISLQDIKQNELVSKLNKLRDLVNDHEALQNHIEDLTAPRDDNAEFVTDCQLLIKHSQLVDNLENLHNMHQIWCVGNHAKHDA